MRARVISHILPVIVILVLSFPAVRALFQSGFYPMHDDTQVARVVEMGRALREGQFPVRWVGDLGYGYGYPIFNFYGPLPYYFGGLLYLLGLSGLTATKIMLGVGMVLAPIAGYALIAPRFGKLAGVGGALLYMYMPYHAVQLYVRGAAGELWAIAFLPFFLSSVLPSRSGRKSGMVWGGLALAGIVTSHTVIGYVAALTTIVCVAIDTASCIFRGVFDRDRALHFVGILAVGLGLSGFFWLPAVTEKGFTDVSREIGASAYFADHYVCLTQLWSSSWGFGGSAPGCVDGMSYKLGKLHLLLAAASVIVWVALRKKQQLLTGFYVFWITLAVASVFFMIQWSQGIWRIVPGIAYLQYPWRILSITGLSLSVIASALVYLAPRKYAVVILFGLATLCIALNGRLFVPQYSYVRNSAEFESDEDLRYRVSKISDEYLPRDIPRPVLAQDIIRDTISVPVGVKKTTEIDLITYARFRMITESVSNVSVKRAYFPGWKYLINGTEIHPLIVNGLPSIDLPAGESVLELRLTDTPVRSIGNILSISTILVLLAFYGKKTIA